MFFPICLYAGTVAIWNLKTENRILKAATPDGLTKCKLACITHINAFLVDGFLNEIPAI
jgi:hypothetical protein